jgi:very-short-patch-repair endonuclease
MPDDKPTRHIHPAILTRARELRRPMTPQEAKLWNRLRGKQLYGIKFRRQHPIFRFVLDFFCYQHQLVIEIDGGHHADSDQQDYDEARTEWLEEHGMRVIRFTNRDIDTNIEGVLQEIARRCGIEEEAPQRASFRSSPQRGELEEGEVNIAS